MLDREGQQFGNYRLIRLLGRGGFAEVYLGENIHVSPLQVAIKVLNAQLVVTDGNSFLQEARMLAQLKHPHIVEIKDFAIERGIPYLVMAYAPNGTLRQHHNQGQRVSLATVVSYTTQIASALQYAHDRRVIHRDLKPENMLIGSNGDVLLSDFGIAVISSTSRPQGPQGAAGTALYMAPEQIMGQALAASDQYALGVVVYEWLSGNPPFHGSFQEITAQHLHATPPSLSTQGVAISPQVEAVIMRALAKDSQQRFASVQEFALALSRSNVKQNSSPRLSTSGNPSIVVSPPKKSSNITYNNAPQVQQATPPGATPPLAQTPQTPPYHQPSQGLPPTRQAPPYATPTYPYVPTQPATPYVTATAKRKGASPCLATTAITIVILVLLVGGTIFAAPALFSWFQHSTSPGTTGGTSSTGLPSSTPSVAPTATSNGGSTQGTPVNLTLDKTTLTATNGATSTDCTYWGPFAGAQSGWNCSINLRNSGQGTVNWTAIADDSQVVFQPDSTGFLFAGSSWDLTVHVPLKDCPGNVTITIQPTGGTAQQVAWNCS